MATCRDFFGHLKPLRYTAGTHICGRTSCVCSCHNTVIRWFEIQGRADGTSLTTGELRGFCPDHLPNPEMIGEGKWYREIPEPPRETWEVTV